MFVLQECSICFEEFDSERYPHTIPCGHVFCQSCLESLVTTSPNCPNCRVSYASASIRKVVGTIQDQAENDQAHAPQESEAEALMWQATLSALESPKERKSFVQNNSEVAMLAAGMSTNVCTAMSIMRLLVEVEDKNHSLEDKLNTARAVEESLCDRISTLEAQLEAFSARSGPSSQDFKLLMADVHKLRSTVEAIDKNTLDIASRLNSAPPSSLLLDNPTQTSQPEIKSPTPPPAPNLALEPTRTRPALLRKSPPHSNKSLLASPSETPTSSRLSFSFGASARQEPSVPEQYPLPGASFSAKQPISPPPTPASVPENLDGKSVLGSPSPVAKRNSMAFKFGASASNNQVSHPENLRTLRHSIALPGYSPQPVETPSTPVSQPQPTATHTNLGRAPPPALAPKPSKPQPSSRTLTVLYDFTADPHSSTELCLKPGQKLILLPESDTDKDWIWCRTETGQTGYAPRAYIKVDAA